MKTGQRWIVAAIAGACGAGGCWDASDGTGGEAGRAGTSSEAGRGGAPAAPGRAELGRACQPSAVPDCCFEEQEAYLEGDNAACGEGMCLVFRLAGDPRPACREQPGACNASDPGCQGSARCADPAEVQRHVHCTCRCDGPDSQAPFCECPDDFQCVPLLQQGDPSVVGSYCVRN